MILRLALKSVRNRALSVTLTVLSIALSVLLLLGVERVRDEARGSFTATVAGTDLIVGARASPVHLLLYSVFHVGYANNNLSWDSYRAIAARPEVAWTIPLSMGDSYRAHRVVGTTADFFRHFRFGQNQSLHMAQGRAFATEQEAVIGADVARRLGLGLGSNLVLAHGAGDVSFIQHNDHPLRVAGVLARTGTPVDRALYVSLDTINRLHEEPGDHAFDPLRDADKHPGAHAQQEAGTPITAVLVGLQSRASALGVQRSINTSKAEPLTALMPGPTLQELWEILGAMEKTLFAVSALVVLVGLAGMLVALLSGLNERRREMAILRSVGARPGHVFALILGEAGLLTLSGIVSGALALYAGLLLGRPWLETQLGLFIPWRWPSLHECALMAAVAVAGLLIGLLPAYRTYRHSLADGMTVHL